MIINIDDKNDIVVSFTNKENDFHKASIIFIKLFHEIFKLNLNFYYFHDKLI